MDILEKAKDVTENKRENEYGDEDMCFEHIAHLWHEYLSIKCEQSQGVTKLEKKDVAHMMILMKIARELMGHKGDNYVDIAGYARCASRMSGDEEIGDDKDV